MSSMLFYPGTPSVSGSGAGPFRPGSGSVTAPTYSFAASTNSGMYWDTGHGGGLGFANQGVEFMYFDNTNQAIVGRPGGGTGFALMNLGTNQLYVKTGDNGSYTNINTNGFNVIGRTSTAANCGFQNNSAGSGVYGDSSTCGLATSGVSGLLLDNSQRISMIKRQVASKTGNYPVTAADSFTEFDNAGAAGAVIFTLPTAALGLTYTFSAVVAQQIKVQAGGSDAISMAGNSKAAGGLLTGPAATQGATVTITCTSANMWTVTAFQGTWT